MKSCTAGIETPGLITHQRVGLNFSLLILEAYPSFLPVVRIPWSCSRSSLLLRLSCEKIHSPGLVLY